MLSKNALARILVVTGAVALSRPATAQTPAPAAPASDKAAPDQKPAVDLSTLLTKARELGAAKDWASLRQVAKEIVAADANNADGNAWLGLAAKNLKKCREATKPLSRSLGKSTVPGVARALAECLGPSPKDKPLAGRAWLAAAREDKDGDEAMKAAKLFSGNSKTAHQLYEAYSYADAQGKLPADATVAYAEAATAVKKLAEAKKIYEKALEKKPGERSMMLPLARLRLQTKDADGTEALVAELLKANPDDAESLILRADAAAARGDAALEEQTLRQALAKQDKNEALKKRFATVLGSQARAKIDAGDSKAAREKAEEALKLDAKSAAANDALGRALYAEGDKVKAEKILRTLGDFPDAQLSGEGLRLAAETAMDAKEPGKAKALLDRAAKLGAKRLPLSRARLAYLGGDLSAAEKQVAAQLNATPGDGEALRLGGDVAYESGKVKLARERFEAADQAGALPPRGQARLCEARVRDDAFEAAKQACQKAMAGGIDEASVHASMGLAMFRLGDKSGAKKEIGVAASKGAKDKSTLLVQGLLAEADGRDAEAMAFYDKVLAQDAANVEANAQSGKLLLKRAKYAEAAKRLQKAFKADPQNAATAVPLAKAQLGAGRLGDAQRTIKALPEGAVDQPTRLGLDGQVQSALGNHKKANELYEKALKHKPGDAELLALQGQNYLKLPHYEKAISLLEQAQKADPSRTDVVEQLAQLYAETGNTQKAAQQLSKLEAIDKTEVDQQRKTIDGKDIKRVAYKDLFETVGKIDDPQLANLNRGLRDLVVADLARSPYIQVIDHTEEGRKAVEEVRDRLIADKDTTKGEVQAELAAGYVLTGSFQSAGDSLSVSCTITDLHTKRSWGGSETGPKEKYLELEKRAVLQMLSSFVPLSERERAALERATGANLESFVKVTEAEAAKKRGDLRAALQLFKEAQAADARNARAAVGLDEAKREVSQRNHVAVLAPEVVGKVEPELVLGLRHTLTSKLASVQGIRVIDNERVDTALAAQRDYLIEHKDNLDPKTIPQESSTEIAANVLLQPTIEASGEGITVGATLVDYKDHALLLGDQVNGPKPKLLDLQNELAVNIVKKLYGEPTEQEMETLRKKQSMDEYKAQMAELARLRAEEQARKDKQAAPAAIASQPSTASGKTGEQPKKLTSVPKPLTPVAAPVPPTVTVRPDPGPQPMFQVGLRSAVTAKDLNNDSHLGGGLMMTWVAMWTKHARAAFVAGFESTSWTGRNEAGKGHTSYYGLGLDLDIPIAYKGNGLILGAEAGYGLMQSIAGTLQSPVQGGVLMLMPHAGLRFSIKGVGLFADAGWRFEFLKKDALRDASLGGLVLQGGLQLDMDEGSRDRTKGGEIAYQARVFSPNDRSVHNKYGSTLLGHELTFLWTGNRSTNVDNGFAIAYLGGSSNVSGEKGLQLVEMSWVFKWHAFPSHQFVNPYLGWRLGVVGSKSHFDDSESHLLTAGIVGADIYLGRHFALRGGASYDHLWGTTSDEVSYSGYAVEAGAVLRY